MMSMFGNMGGENRQSGFGGYGGGFGGGRMMRPFMQAWRQNGGDDWRSGMQNWMQSQPFQDWRATMPQRPEGGWTDPMARRTAYSNWFNQAPDAPWGPMPDWMPHSGGGQTPPATPPAQGSGGQPMSANGFSLPPGWNEMIQQKMNGANGGFLGFLKGLGQFGNIFRGLPGAGGGPGGQPGGTPAPAPQPPPMAQFPQYSQGWATRGLPPGIPISQLLQAATGSPATPPAASGSRRNWRD